MGIETLKQIVDEVERENFFQLKMVMCKQYYEIVFKPWFNRAITGFNDYEAKGLIKTERDKEFFNALKEVKPILKELENRSEFKQVKAIYSN